jgi:serine/threonine protein kinase
MNGFPGAENNAALIADSTVAGGSSFQMGLHATLTFDEVAQSGEPTNPLDETVKPDIFRGKRNVKVRVIPANGSDVRLEQVFLKRVTADGCRQVYRKVKEKKKTADKKAQYDGVVLFALRMELVEGHSDLYREPRPEDADNHLVAIKKQSLAKIKYHVDRGHHENPYTAISRMQTIGDDVHVLGCIEALTDNKNLYTIMRYCDGGIMDMLLDDDGEHLHSVPENTARDCITKVWKNLRYLQEHGIVHHDLSPDNIMSLSGVLVLTDLAMSLKVSHDPTEQQIRRLLLPQGRYGKDPYLSPEAFTSQSPFDGFGLDLWASGCVLYNLLTGHHLYHQPYPTDTLFKYFVMAKGLSNTPLNERTLEIMVDVFQNGASHVDQQPLMTRAMAHIQLSPTSVQLMENMLEINPAKRYTLAQCMESSWAWGDELLYLDPANSRRNAQ